MTVYTGLLRPLLFRLSAERAHKTSEAVLRMNTLWSILRPLFDLKDTRLNTKLGSIDISNPVGLAAGFDKDCRMLNSLSSLGFGYLVGGTVVSSPRDGNPKPRIVRNPKERSLVNSLGFPSLGAQNVSATLSKNRPHGTPVMVSISGLTEEDFAYCFDSFQPLSDGIELNISSPNTEGIRVFQSPSRLKGLLGELSHLKRKPVIMKLPPYFNADQRGHVFDLIRISLDHGLEGITVANTWPIEDNRLKMGRGGLSGEPLFGRTLEMIKEIRHQFGCDFVINACGGISSGGQAIEALMAGANTIQLYSSLIYHGPTLIKNMNREILSLLDSKHLSGISNLSDLETII